MTDEAGRGQIVTFYSYKGGTGRTMALANVAWILASWGNRVLIVDWDLESPGLHRYFHPFLTDKMLRDTPGVVDMIQEFATASLQPTQHGDDRPDLGTLADVTPYTHGLDWSFPDNGLIDLMPAGRQNEFYAGWVSTFDWWTLYDDLDGGAFLEQVRDDMHSKYDYVLIDSRTGLTDTSGICTVLLPDMVIDCFTLATQSIEGAAAVAQSIHDQRTDRPVRIRPVPMRVELAEKTKLETGRDVARRHFLPFLNDLDKEQVDAYWSDIEIPYQPFYAYEEILAPFGDRPRQKGTMLSAFERLAAMIGDRPGGQLSPVPDDVRYRWLAEFERSAGHGRDVHVFYASADRLWAEWVVSEVGAERTTTWPVDAPGEDWANALEKAAMGSGRMVVILSEDFRAVPHSQDVRTALGLDRAPQAGRVVLIGVDPAGQAWRTLGQAHLEPTASDPQSASSELRRALAMPDAGDRGPGWRPHAVLRRRTPRWNVTPETGFVGRGAVLEELRGLLTSPSPKRHTIYGLAGVGKTSLTNEYARRFRFDYDVAWVIQGDDSAHIAHSLSELAREMRQEIREELRSTVGDVDSENARMALRLIAKGPITDRRWLLIYNDLDAPTDEVLQLVADAAPNVHVILTTREPHWEAYGTTSRLDRFSRDESIRLLLRDLPNVTSKEAAKVAERVGDLPIAVAGAAAYLKESALPVALYLGQLSSSELLRIVTDDADATESGDSTAEAWLLTLRRLRAASPAAAWLLELCAILAPDPIPVDTLVGSELRDLLMAQDGQSRTPIQQGFLTGELGRYALAQVHPTTNTVQLHPLVRLVIRDQLADEAALREAAHRILAGAKPQDPDRPRDWRAFHDLWPHAREVRVVEADFPAARELVVDLARYLYRRGDYPATTELCNAALESWRHHGADDPLVLRIRFHLANTLRAQGRLAEAYEIDKDVYDRQRLVHGPTKRITLATARSLGYDLRAHGKYTEAEALDRQTRDGFRDILGPDSAETLIAENNLAVSLRLLGSYREASRLAQRVYEKRRDRFTERDTAALTAASSYGRDLCDLGELWSAHQLLQDTLSLQSEVAGENHPETLRTARNLAITLRQLGRFDKAHRLARETLERYRESENKDHPDALACTHTLAVVTAATGDTDQALDIVGRLFRRYEVLLGPAHIFTLACRSSMSVFMSARSAESGLPLTQRVLDELERTLPEKHPNIAMARINLADALFRTGKKKRALELDEKGYSGLAIKFGISHPDALTAQVNFAVSLAANDQDAKAEPLFESALEHAVRLYGGDNPRVEQTRRRERSNVYLEPTFL